ncbi:MAG: hypothetical protein R3E01_25350 [Pirellulaceae bacterium]
MSETIREGLASGTERRALRRGIYLLLALVSLVNMAARIAVVSSEHKHPFLSANDRSRMVAIRAMVDHGTFIIDDVTSDKGWHTIDKVYHETSKDDEKHYFSSKPVLFLTVLAGEYYALQQMFGCNIAENPYFVGRTIIMLTNVAPMALLFWIIAWFLEEWGTTDWGRIFVMFAATHGTYLSTYAITINNHVPAAVTTAITLWAVVKIIYLQSRSGWLFALAGLASAMTAANELPALSLLAATGLALLYVDPKRTLMFYTPAAAVIVVAFFATNYLAHEDLRPPYMHRDWYVYPKSHWLPENRKGIDAGEPIRWKYALHMLVGHHGIFSLTPLWILSIFGLGMMIVKKQQRWLAAAVLTLTIVCIMFYISRPLQDRNYGGMTSGFRWMFWFAPMWLVALIPVADSLGRSRWGRTVCAVALGVSAFSAAYPALNPWTHPWIYRVGQAFEWLPLP